MAYGEEIAPAPALEPVQPAGSRVENRRDLRAGDGDAENLRQIDLDSAVAGGEVGTRCRPPAGLRGHGLAPASSILAVQGACGV
jgi:hypothetical protein